MIHSLIFRKLLLQAKLAGKIESLSWPSLLSLLPKSTSRWPFERFAVPASPPAADGLVLFETAVGRFWAPPPEREALGGTIIEMLCNVYERGPVAVRPGDIVIDLGANLGTFARVALDKGAGRVVCLEANPLMVRALEKTFAIEIASGKVLIVPSPAWSSVTTVRFSGQSLTGRITEEGEPMQTVTIDGIVESLGLPRVDFIKSDIEGAERHALLGASRTLARFTPRLAFCIYHYPDDKQVISSIVESAGSYQLQFEPTGRYIYCSPAAGS